MGVFVHGFAGDLAKAALGETAMKASDIIYYFPKAFMQLEASNRFL
jgi:NAD(P)H-hydrate repair Nnr-like enzyme with NAD(P)H-hydrate dehydratase domain